MRALLWSGLFCAGLLVGFFVGQGWHRPEVSQASAPVEVAAVPPANVSSRRSDAAADSVAASPREQALAPAVPAASAARAEPLTAPVVPTPTSATSPFLPVIDSGVVVSIDAGEVLNRQIARPSTPDQPNQLGDMHRALEREPRDDSWAYSMEAELTNSMVNETSMGKFSMEHVECRSTICEVRVSGTGEQADDVRAWSDALRNDPVNQQLFLNVSSSISSHERVDAIYIFRRPAKKP